MSLKKQHITAVILAGGKGSRLGGQDKGLLPFQNKPLIEHVLAQITPQLDHIIISANRNLESYARYGYTVISDDVIHGSTFNNRLNNKSSNSNKESYQGPLAGFLSAMKYVDTDYIITLPCDGPKLPSNLLKRLLDNLNSSDEKNNKGKNIAVAHDGERIQSVYALIPVSLVNNLEQFLNSGNRKVELWYSQQKLTVVDFSDVKDTFFNINEKEQLNEENTS